MNWLIYIAGFVPFWAVFNQIITVKNERATEIFIKVISALCIWVWICWRFI